MSDYEVQWHGALWREFAPPVVATPRVNPRIMPKGDRDRPYGAVEMLVRGAFAEEPTTIVDIATRTGLGGDQVRYALKRLIHAGIVARVGKWRGCIGARYQLTRKATAV